MSSLCSLISSIGHFFFDVRVILLFVNNIYLSLLVILWLMEQTIVNPENDQKVTRILKKNSKFWLIDLKNGRFSKGN